MAPDGGKRSIRGIQHQSAGPQGESFLFHRARVSQSIPPSRLALTQINSHLWRGKGWKRGVRSSARNSRGSAEKLCGVFLVRCPSFLSHVTSGFIDGMWRLNPEALYCLKLRLLDEFTNNAHPWCALSEQPTRPPPSLKALCIRDKRFTSISLVFHFSGQPQHKFSMTPLKTTQNKMEQKYIYIWNRKSDAK